MSSEMRDVKALVDLVVDCIANGRRDEALLHSEQAQNALARALLARTEAGADGYDDGSGRVRDWRESDTHPHDASGDAEVRELRRVLNKLADYWIAITRDKDVAHRDRAIIDAYDKGLTKCAAELRAAMQAKEAK